MNKKLLTLILLAIFSISLIYYFSFPPLIISKNKNFDIFRKEVSPKILEFLKNENLSENQKFLLTFNHSEIVDLFILDTWNSTIFMEFMFSGDDLGVVQKYIRDKIANIMAFILNYKNITDLNISNFKLSYIPITALQFFENLKNLKMDSVDISLGYEKLKKLPFLENLSIKNNNIKILPDFRDFPMLKSVNLELNPIKINDQQRNSSITIKY